MGRDHQQRSAQSVPEFRLTLLAQNRAGIGHIRADGDPPDTESLPETGGPVGAHAQVGLHPGERIFKRRHVTEVDPMLEHERKSAAHERQTGSAFEHHIVPVVMNTIVPLPAGW